MMKQNEYYIIGQMSGTSLDGVDLVYVKIGFKEKFYFEILNYQTVSYSPQWKQNLINGFKLSGDNLKKLDKDYGELLAEIISTFIKENKIEKIDFISSHGHTIFHKPEKGYTLQIGNGPEIHNLTNMKTICDFRIQDVELGGQGAPLVPIGDRLLFWKYNYCINFGGIANISYEFKGDRIAYDICPVNMVLNYYSQKIGLEYDAAGQFASTGHINTELLNQLNQLDYYHISPPKSLGREWVENKVFPLIEKFKLKPIDVLGTFTEHIKFQIAEILRSFPDGKILITGGGAKNTFLIDQLQKTLDSEIIIPDKTTIDYKEALVFAFLGVLRWRNEVNCLASVTGASRDCSGGVIIK